MKKLMRTVAACLVLSLAALSLMSCDAEKRQDAPEKSANSVQSEEAVVGYSIMHADWPYYPGAQAIAEHSDDIFTGKVTGISFEIIHGDSPATKDDDPSKNHLYTAYEIEVDTVYKGDVAGTVYVLFPGGRKDFRENAQLSLMREYGMKTAFGVPLAAESKSLEIGDVFVFSTINSYDVAHNNIINPEQTALSPNSQEGYALIDYMESQSNEA